MSIEALKRILGKHPMPAPRVRAASVVVRPAALAKALQAGHKAEKAELRRRQKGASKTSKPTTTKPKATTPFLFLKRR